MKILFVILIFISSLNLAYSESKNKLLNGVITVDEANYKSSFTILKKENRHYLKVHPSNSSESCIYKIKKINAPQQIKGRSGTIWANREEQCKYNIKDSVESKFWRDVVLLDISYHFNSNFKLEGKIVIDSVSETHYGTVIFNK